MIRFLEFIVRRANLFILLIFALTIFLGYKSLSIEMDSDFYSIYPKNNERVENLLKETGLSEKTELYIALSVQAEDALSVEKLNLFYDAVKKISVSPAITNTLSPFNFITFQNDSGRFSIEKISEMPPQTAAELEIFKKRLLNESLAKDLVFSQDGKILNAIFSYDDLINSTELSELFLESIEPLNGAFKVYYTGDVFFSESTVSYLQKDLFRLIYLSLIVILVVLFFSFRAFRAILLPVITVSTAAVWALGFSVIMGYKLSVVSVVLPVIVLAIGSSYTVHILNEYFRVFTGSNDKDENIREICSTVSHIMMTILLAGLTTIIGFCGLFFTSITPLKEFALSVSFGIFSCVILSLFFLPAMLVKLRHPRAIHKQIMTSGSFLVLMKKTAQFVIKRHKFIIFSFLIIIVLAVFLYPKISRQVDYIDYFPSGDPIIENTLKIQNFIGGGQVINITLKAPPGSKNYFLKKEVVKGIYELQQGLIEHEDVLKVVSVYSILEEINQVMYGKSGIPTNQGLINLLARYFKLLQKSSVDMTFASNGEFINEDFSQITLFLNVYDGKTGKYIIDSEIQKLSIYIEELIAEKSNIIPTYYIWGTALLSYDAGLKIQKEQLIATILSIIMIAIVASIFFKSIFYGLLSLVPLISAISLNYIIMVIFRIPLDITTVLVANVAIGVGVDDAIHFILQYRKQLIVHSKEKNAVIESFIRTGRPILLTTISIVAGMLMMCFASFKPVIFFGILVSTSLISAMFSTLLILPCVLLVFRKKSESLTAEDSSSKYK